jgi:hypothetical protein
MKRHVAFSLPALLLGILLAGCEPPKPIAGSGGSLAPPAPPPPPGAEAPPPPISGPSAATGPSSQAPLPIETKVGVFAGTLDDLAAGPRTAPAAQSAPAPPPADPSSELVKAEKGVGLKGRSLDEYEGAVVTPAKAFFAAKERIAFEIEVPHALQLYEATSGQAPKTHQEFMENVIKANQIKLPVLPPGHEYVYDPEGKQLMVKRPKKQ